MKRLQPIDRLDRLSLYVPCEEPQHDLVFREVGEDKAMLLDRLDLLLEIENRRGRGRCAANAYRRPTARPRPDRSRQGDVDGIAFEIERAAAVPSAIECMSPLKTRGMRPFILVIGLKSRSRMAKRIYALTQCRLRRP
jgi:hypothetical protein